MKIRHGVISFVALYIALVILGGDYLPIDYRVQEMLIDVTSILAIVSLGLLIYLIVRNIVRAIIGAMKKPKEP